MLPLMSLKQLLLLLVTYFCSKNSNKSELSIRKLKNRTECDYLILDSYLYQNPTEIEFNMENLFVFNDFLNDYCHLSKEYSQPNSLKTNFDDKICINEFESSQISANNSALEKDEVLEQIEFPLSSNLSTSEKTNIKILSNNAVLENLSFLDNNIEVDTFDDIENNQIIDLEKNYCNNKPELFRTNKKEICLFTEEFKFFSYGKKSKTYKMIKGVNNLDSFFNSYLADISDSEIGEIRKEMEINIKGTMFSFGLISQICPSLLMQFNKRFNFCFIKTIGNLEERFFFCLKHIYRCFCGPVQKTISNLIDYKNNPKETKKFFQFYDKFIDNKYVNDYFIKPNVNSDEIIMENFDQILDSLVNEFNNFFSCYLEEMVLFLDAPVRDYFPSKNTFFYNRNSIDTQKRLKVWLEDLLNNETNLFLLILFPELKCLLNEVNKTQSAALNSKKFHMFFSLILLKYTAFLNFFSLILKYNKDSSTFKITDSKFLNLFILDLRCFIYVFCKNLLYFLI